MVTESLVSHRICEIHWRLCYTKRRIHIIFSLQSYVLYNVTLFCFPFAPFYFSSSFFFYAYLNLSISSIVSSSIISCSFFLNGSNLTCSFIRKSNNSSFLFLFRADRSGEESLKFTVLRLYKPPRSLLALKRFIEDLLLTLLVSSLSLESKSSSLIGIGWYLVLIIGSGLKLS